MAKESHKITIGVVGLAFSNIAGNRYGRTAQLADKAELLVRWKSVRRIVDHRYQLHSLLPRNQVFVTAGHIVSLRDGALPRDSGLGTQD
jgi:hypothetical protein